MWRCITAPRWRKRATAATTREYVVEHDSRSPSRCRDHRHRPQAPREMKREIDRLAKRRSKFDLTFMTRSLVAVVRRRAEYETNHRADRSELEEGWRDVVRPSGVIRWMLPGRLHVGYDPLPICTSRIASLEGPEGNGQG